MVAEYERAKILERSRRGKRHAARQGAVSVLSGAPHGYRYVGKRDGGVARYEILEDEARIVRRIFAWIGRERDRKGTRLNSSHAHISYAVFCLTQNYSRQY